MAGPRILIGIPSAQEGRYRPFDVALHALIEDRQDAKVFFAMTGVVPGARNRIVREALRLETEYIWFLDDDQPFHPGSPGRSSDLDQLLAHQLEAVIPLSVRRGPPFLPLIYDAVDGWEAKQHFLRDHEHGLIRVAGAGFAGLLIKTEIFRRMGTDGWFEFVHPPHNPDDYAEDFPFYRKLAALDVPLYCDLDVRFGHAFSSVLYPIKQQGKWVTVMATDKPFAAIPQMPAPHGIVPPSPSEIQALAKAHA